MPYYTILYYTILYYKSQFPLIAKTNADIYLLLLVLCLFKENIFRNTPRWLFLKHRNGIFNKHNTNDSKCGNDTCSEKIYNDNNNDNDKNNSNNNAYTNNRGRIEGQQ